MTSREIQKALSKLVKANVALKTARDSYEDVINGNFTTLEILAETRLKHLKRAQEDLDASVDLLVKLSHEVARKEIREAIYS